MRKLRIVAAVVAVTAGVLSAPARALPAGVVSSPNVELLGVIPEQGAVGGRVFEQNGTRYFLFTGIGGVSVYDITDPELPLLAGHLELPHEENEDVDYCGGFALVARDPAFDGVGGLNIIDLRNLPLITLAYTGDPRGFNTDPTAVSFFYDEEQYPGGHTAAFVTEDCRWVYATSVGGGARPAYVIDLADPSNPILANIFGRSGDNRLPGGTHDFYRDETGLVWAVGGSGVTALDVSDPVNPVLVSDGDGTRAISSSEFNHNMLRPRAGEYRPRAGWELGDPLEPGEKLLITNENYIAPACSDQGRFGTAAAVNHETPNEDGTYPIVMLDSWTPPMGEPGGPSLGGQMDGNNAVPPVVCSAHWFDERNDLVAIGWYQQGTRILDVSDPYDIREVGWFLTPDAMTWAAYWITDDIVYSLDQTHGINILRVNASAGESAAVRPPRFAPRRGLPGLPAFAYACVAPPPGGLAE